MAKYNVEYVCGHEAVVQLYGKNSEREKKLNWMAKNLCPDCWKKENERIKMEHNVACAEINAQAGLPALEGSEKQIAWAESIRKDAIARLFDNYDEWIADIERIKSDVKLLDRHNRVAVKDGFKNFEDLAGRLIAAKFTIRNEVSAHWWIDHREILVMNPDKLTKTIALASRIDDLEKKPEAELAKEESTLRPKQPITETIAQIKVCDQSVEVVFPEKRKDFWEIIKIQMQYSWAGNRWTRVAGITCKSAKDLAAETGNALLTSGFIVRCFDEQIRSMILDASFEHENSKLIRKIVGTEFDGYFGISWTRNDGDFYKAARQITSSRYRKRMVLIAPEHFDQVIDFAQMYGFKLSQGAQEIVQNARAAKEYAITATPVAASQKNKTSTARPNLDPSTAGAIDQELIDVG